MSRNRSVSSRSSRFSTMKNPSSSKSAIWSSVNSNAAIESSRNVDCIIEDLNNGGTMQSVNRFAFKEWAVTCQALAAGRQSLLLRKGGIHERDGRFGAGA